MSKIVIVGCCSAVSEQQIINTAAAYEHMTGVIFRAGIWKPRTSPNSFEGVGEKGLAWLAKVQGLLNIPTITEVATVEHIRLVHKYGINNVWIGARTVTNPFLVDELAEELSKYPEMTVFVKNPISPDKDLWIGSFKRFVNKGVRNLRVIHRGFSVYPRGKYRNDPIWQFMYDFTSTFPDVPIIGDASHIAGHRDYVNEVVDMFKILNYDGIMLESDIDPSKAKTDSIQHLTTSDSIITIQNFKGDWDNIQTTNTISRRREDMERRKVIRQAINEVDENIIKLLAVRYNHVYQVGLSKQGVIYDKHRYSELIHNLEKVAEREGVSPKLVKDIYSVIHAESVREQVCNWQNTKTK